MNGRVQNGPHDTGGAREFGAIDRTLDAKAYPEGWEGRCAGALIAAITAGIFNADEMRARIEEIPSAAYWSMGYFRRWQHTLERNCILKGTFTEQEIADRAEALAAGEAEFVDRDDPEFLQMVIDLIEHGAPLHVDIDRPPRFTVGDRVRTRRIVVEERGSHHTRLPGYAQEKPGIVERCYPAMPLSDARAEGRDEADYVYSVSFAASALWPDGDAVSRVSVDVFESYIDPEES
jgi:nitrile hydratase